MLAFHSGLSQLFFLWISKGENAVHAFGILTEMAKAEFCPGSPQAPLNIPELSFLGMERGKKKPSGKGSGLQEKDSVPRNPWMETKGGKGKMGVREQAQNEEIGQKGCDEFCSVFCPWAQIHTDHCM